ncbi:MAG: hypothetical protein KGJ07_07415, partial [Patescibacteria group bacterium]|nr:hypothetical protein [Patescibacteria group bacterium]
GPLIILFGVVPGLKMGFGSWIKTLVANLSLFPAILFFLILGAEIADAVNNAKNYFVPPLVGSLLPDKMGSVIGFAVVMISPKLIDEIPKMLKAQGGLGDAVMGGFQGGQALAGATVGKGIKSAFRAPDPYRGLNEGWGRRAVLGTGAGMSSTDLKATGWRGWRRRAFYRITGYNPDKQFGAHNPAGGETARGGK